MSAEDHIEDEPLYDDDLEDECLHENIEINLVGIAECYDCGHSWMASDEEFERYCHLMRGPNAWDRFVYAIREFIDRLRWRFKKREAGDDEIPF